MATNETRGELNEASDGSNAHENDDNEDDEDGAATPEHISMALCSMLSGNPFNQMRMPSNCPPNFFMNPALVASQLQCLFFI